ncbi:MAG: Mbeg1-like protein [Blautia massiliensis (ex Durand et al. 2017)]
MELPDGTAYISFRGTDDTIVGWKEDFNLSNGIVPSHRKALEYLEFNGTYMQSMIRTRRAFQGRKSGYVHGNAV